MKTMLKMIAGAILAATAAAPSIVPAQEIDLLGVLEGYAGTISVSFVAGLSKGDLTGCYLEFEHLQRDGLYLGGNFIRISGSVGLMAGEGNVGFVMKAVAKEVDAVSIEAPPRQLTLGRIYLVGTEHSTNFHSLIASSASDTPGGVFSVFQLDPGISMLLEGLTSGTVGIAVAIGDGLSDIQLPINLLVEQTLDDGRRIETDVATVGFLDCAQSLMASTL